MPPVSTRRAERAARRAEESGSGPVREERPVARFPGATARFALFGEVMLVGVLVTVGGALVITLPAALAAGVRHLRRFAAAEGSPMSAFWADYRRALPGGAPIGLAAAAAAGILALDVVVAGSGALPGGPVIAGVGWVGLVALGAGMLMAASEWTPDLPWWAALRAVPGRVAHDPVAALYVAVAVVLTGVVTWMLFLLLVPALGCAVLAALAAPHRRVRRS